MKYLVLFLSFITFSLASCDKCKDVSCLNGGSCSDGSCVCANGFSGDKCEVEDKCVSNNVTCEHGKTCVNGKCDCGDWYTGDDCGNKVTAAHEGLYNGSWTCSGYPGLVSFVDKDDAENKMTISETGSDRVYEAIFSGERLFSIPSQTISDEYGSPVVSGSGSFTSGGALTLSVSYDYTSQGSSTANCVFSGN